MEWKQKGCFFYVANKRFILISQNIVINTTTVELNTVDE